MPKASVSLRDQLLGLKPTGCELSLWQEAIDAWLQGDDSLMKQLALPSDDSLGTTFQQAVWQALQAIPWGETRTYGQLASTIGRPKATRAVGQALARNPYLLFWPCPACHSPRSHYVIMAHMLVRYGASPVT